MLHNSSSPLGWSTPYPSPIQSVDSGIIIPPWKRYWPNFAGCSQQNPVIFAGQQLLPMQGSRRADRMLLLRSLGRQQQNNRGLVCHHLFDYDDSTNPPQAVMQLVDAATHASTCPHVGAVNQWNNDPARHHAYRTEMDCENVPPVAPPTSCTEAQLTAVLGRSPMAPLMMRVYVMGQALPGLWRDDAGNTYHLMELLPLRAADGGNNSVEAMSALLDRRPISKAPGKTNQVVGYDDCGNLFITNERGEMYFYDHEEDTQTLVHGA